MSYFKKVKEGQEVFGLVFGPGVVKSVWKDSYYTFEVLYNNHHTVPYTDDGVPGWSGPLDFQTVFYKKDIDVMSIDMAPSEKVLSAKKIIKLRDKKKLMAKCPSGIWSNVRECPNYLIEEYLEEGKLHLFKKAQ